MVTEDDGRALPVNDCSRLEGDARYFAISYPEADSGAGLANVVHQQTRRFAMRLTPQPAQNPAYCAEGHESPPRDNRRTSDQIWVTSKLKQIRYGGLQRR